MTGGKILRELRLNHGYYFQTLAKLLDCSVTTLSAIINERIIPDQLMVEKINKTFPELNGKLKQEDFKINSNLFCKKIEGKEHNFEIKLEYKNEFEKNMYHQTNVCRDCGAITFSTSKKPIKGELND